MQRMKTMRHGLRWSPRPMKEYLAAWNLGPGVAQFHALFTERPDVWNLFWISAANCERPPYLTGNQVAFVSDAARQTADCEVFGRGVGLLTLTLMPTDFADFMEQHESEALQLPLAKILAPHWLWAVRHRAELFYEARKSDSGLVVRPPVSQGETILNDSTNIVSFFNFKGRRRTQERRGPT